MPSPTEITASQLGRLVGLPDTPVILDVRSDDAFARDPRIIPTAIRRDARTAESWAAAFAGKHVVVSCQAGASLSQGAAAWLRQEGATAETLEGGHEAWVRSGGLLVDTTKLPDPPTAGARDARDRTVWVTRSRPKLDRIACPWLVRRFVDRDAVFLFVAPNEVESVAEKFRATPFDVEGVHFSHRGETCTFDTMLVEFGLESPAIQQLALIVRGADTARLDVAPEAAGLLAMSVGFSRMYKDDLEQLEAAIPMYDALYRRLRDAAEETHNWPATKTAKA
jgi:rhodanese-related sulfurtransferase